MFLITNHEVDDSVTAVLADDQCCQLVWFQIPYPQNRPKRPQHPDYNDTEHSPTDKVSDEWVSRVRQSFCAAAVTPSSTVTLTTVRDASPYTITSWTQTNWTEGVEVLNEDSDFNPLQYQVSLHTIHST